jgi:Mlc titration factor MtfA (ptsG expression regulator)
MLHNGNRLNRIYLTGENLIFSWFKNRRRKRVNSHPVPDAWRAIIESRLPYVATLPFPQQEELLNFTQIFLTEKYFEGCNGFQITDDVRVTIAAQACILLLNRKTDIYPRLKTVLVYESAFYAEQEEYDEDGLVSISDEAHAGESWDIGVVILAWEEIVRGLRHPHDGYNVIIHEFAHQLDHENMETGGVPILDEQSLYPRWQEVFSEHYAGLLKDLQRHKKTVLDDYAATNPAEFFAVATESFFEESAKLEKRHPELYEVLSEYYKQDPAPREFKE